VDSKDFAPGDEFETMVFSAAKDRIFRKMSGKRSLVRSRRPPGRYVAARREKGGTVALDATIRAAIMGAAGVGKVNVEPQHIMYKEYLKRAGNLVLFLLDGSSSIETQRKIGFLKSSVKAVLKDAYVRRDRVSIIVFRDRIAEVLLSPTSSVRKAMMAVDGIRSGGTTPLSLGLYGAYKVMQKEKRRSPDHPIYLMVITDGKANISAFGGDPYLESLHMAGKIRRLAITSALVDVTRLNVALEPLRRKLEMWENGMRSSEIFYSGRARMLAEELKGDYLSLGELARDVQVSAYSRRQRII
jgi:magnesium chelatase subunit D